MTKHLSQGESAQTILDNSSRKDKNSLKVYIEDWEKGRNSEIGKLQWKQGQSIKIRTDSTIRVLYISKIMPSSVMTLNEVKGYVVADYQEYLERQWIAELRQKYPVSLNEFEFGNLIRN